MIHEAIQSLRPNKGFVMYDDNPETIIWDDPQVVTPSQKEIDAAIIAYQEKLKQEAQAIADKKQAILEKLGLTADEVSALLA